MSKTGLVLSTKNFVLEWCPEQHKTFALLFSQIDSLEPKWQNLENLNTLIKARSWLVQLETTRKEPHYKSVPEIIRNKQECLLLYIKWFPSWRGVIFIQKKLSKNKSRKNFYPEVLSKNVFIQNVRDLFYVTL